jgi:hypothetical protein
MNRIVNYLSLVLGWEEEYRYPELYRRETLSGSRILDFDPVTGSGPYRRDETRSLNWKAL